MAPGTRSSAVSVGGTRKRVKVEEEDDAGPRPGPSNGANVVNGADQEQPLIPYLELNNKRLRIIIGGDDEPSIRSVLLFPKTLGMFKTGADAVFSINCTPFICNNLPNNLLRSLYNQHLLPHAPALPLEPDEIPHYVHLGSTSALEFPLDFYIVFSNDYPPPPNPEGPSAPPTPEGPSAPPTPDPDQQLKDFVEEWFDDCILPALRCDALQKYHLQWRTTHDYMAMARAISGDWYDDDPDDPNMRDDKANSIKQSIPLTALDAFWKALNSGEIAKKNFEIGSALLIAYGRVRSPINSALWSNFQRKWELSFDDTKLNEGTRFSFEGNLCCQSSA